MNTLDRIYELMDDNNLNAKDFSEKVGLAGGSITDWKTGRSKPSIDSLEKIADFFNVRIDWLAGKTPYRTIEEEIAKKEEKTYSHLQNTLIRSRFF